CRDSTESMRRAALACSARASCPNRSARGWERPAAVHTPRREERAREAPASDGVSSGVVPLGKGSRRDDLAAAEIAPRHAPADAGHDLVIDRSARLSEILGRLASAALSADEDDVVAFA